MMLVPADSEELNAPSENTTKSAALPSDPHAEVRGGGLGRRAADVPSAAEEAVRITAAMPDANQTRLTEQPMAGAWRGQGLHEPARKLGSGRPSGSGRCDDNAGQMSSLSQGSHAWT